MVYQKFPKDIYRQLDGVDFRLIDELTFLSKLQRERTGASYCLPGREYLARKLAVSVRTVSRHIAKLKGLGVIDAIQRRPVRGQWRSNLYKVVHWIGWRVRQLTGSIRDVWKAVKPRPMGSASSPVPHRGTHVARIAIKEKELTLPDSFFFHSNPIIQCWMARSTP